MFIASTYCRSNRCYAADDLGQMGIKSLIRHLLKKRSQRGDLLASITTGSDKGNRVFLDDLEYSQSFREQLHISTSLNGDDILIELSHPVDDEMFTPDENGKQQFTKEILDIFNEITDSLIMANVDVQIHPDDEYYKAILDIRKVENSMIKEMLDHLKIQLVSI